MLRLRSATEADLPLIMAWRNNPLVYEGFYSQAKPLVWDEHLEWWKSRNQDWRTFIVLYEDRPVGEARVTQCDNWNPELNLYIGEVGLWGRGIGKEALKVLLDWVKEHGYIGTHTTIKDNNIRAIKLFESLGFIRVCDARPGESRYEKNL